MKLKNINSNFFKLIKFILIIKKEVNFLNNNIKTLFLISTLVFLLVSISAISATDIENTTIKDTSSTLKGITWTDFRSSKGLDKIVKVRVDHIGQIVSLGEY